MGSGDEDRHKETEQAFDKAVQMRRQGHGLGGDREEEGLGDTQEGEGCSLSVNWTQT